MDINNLQDFQRQFNENVENPRGKQLFRDSHGKENSHGLLISLEIVWETAFRTLP